MLRFLQNKKLREYDPAEFDPAGYNPIEYDPAEYSPIEYDPAEYNLAEYGLAPKYITQTVLKNVPSPFTAQGTGRFYDPFFIIRVYDPVL